MFIDFLRWLMFGWIRSKRESKQSKRNKQKGKQNHLQSTRGNHKETDKFTHTTQKERDHMYDLRSQGFSVHAIAKKLSRSSRTVYQVLPARALCHCPSRKTSYRIQDSRNMRGSVAVKSGAEDVDVEIRSPPLYYGKL